MPDQALGAALLGIARAAIAERLGGAITATSADLESFPELRAPGAAFVTLTRRGALRGCIGSLEASRPLADDVRQHALDAAFGDPRFPPLTTAEWPDVTIEVSVLTTPRALSFMDEADALRQLRPGIDGVVFCAGGRYATFLPQVWETLPHSADFLAQLKQKAGLPARYWSSTVRLDVYQVRKWKESPA